jgi:mRNA interferase HicA
VRQTELLRRLRRGARKANVDFLFVRHGGAHDIYMYGNQQVPIPRHNEINEQLARGILRQLGIE